MPCDRHCICLEIPTAFVAAALPLPGVFAAFAAKTLLYLSFILRCTVASLSFLDRCLCTAFSPSFRDPPTAFPLHFHCRSMSCHCLSLTFHCLSLPFYYLSTVFPLPIRDGSGGCGERLGCDGRRRLMQACRGGGCRGYVMINVAWCVGLDTVPAREWMIGFYCLLLFRFLSEAFSRGFRLTGLLLGSNMYMMYFVWSPSQQHCAATAACRPRVPPPQPPKACRALPRVVRPSAAAPAPPTDWAEHARRQSGMQRAVPIASVPRASGRRRSAACGGRNSQWSLPVGKSVILLHPPPPLLVGISTGVDKGVSSKWQTRRRLMEPGGSSSISGWRGSPVIGWVFPTSGETYFSQPGRSNQQILAPFDRPCDVMETILLLSL